MTQKTIQFGDDEALKRAAILYKQGKKHALQDESVDGIECMLKALTLLEPMKGEEHRILRGECLYFIGMMELWRGRYGTSHDMMDEATKLNPKIAVYWAFLAQACMHLGADKKAKDCANKAQSTNENNNVVFSMLQTIWEHYGNKQLAEYFEAKAAQFSYNNPDAYFLLGNSNYTKGNKEEADKWYKKALEIDPEHIEANYAHGLILSESLKFKEAIPHFAKGIHSKISGHAAEWGKALAHLTLGEYEQGWKDHEIRFVFMRHEYGIHLTEARFDKSQWKNGLNGRIHVYSEQGFGDCIQFCRYVKLLGYGDHEVTFEVDVTMHEMMKHNFPKANVVPIAKDYPGVMGIPEVDYRIPLGSLPLAFDTRLDTIPLAEGYLKAIPEKVREYRYLRDLPGLKVGLCWAGGKRVQDKNLVSMDEKRSISFDKLKPLLDIDHISFVSLQTGLPAEEAIGIQKPEFKTWSDTAAIITCLDLVISVDTSVLHMAAALGKPTWLLNKYSTCWRWLLDRKDSPWYSSIRIFRPIEPDGWEKVINDVREELVTWRP